MWQRVRVSCVSYRDEPSNWLVALTLNSIALSLSHIAGVTVYNAFGEENRNASGVLATTASVIGVSFVVYIIIYTTSGYVPMGRISDGLRLRRVGARAHQNR